MAYKEFREKGVRSPVSWLVSIGELPAGGCHRGRQSGMGEGASGTVEGWRDI